MKSLSCGAGLLPAVLCVHTMCTVVLYQVMGKCGGGTSVAPGRGGTATCD